MTSLFLVKNQQKKNSKKQPYFVLFCLFAAKSGVAVKLWHWAQARKRAEKLSAGRAFTWSHIGTSLPLYAMFIFLFWITHLDVFVFVLLSSQLILLSWFCSADFAQLILTDSQFIEALFSSNNPIDIEGAFYKQYYPRAPYSYRRKLNTISKYLTTPGRWS